MSVRPRAAPFPRAGWLAAALLACFALPVLASPLSTATAATHDEPARASSSSPARLLISADEFRFTLSRREIARGLALIELVNLGEDDHDLRLSRISRRTGVAVARWRTTPPGELSELELRLRPGRYRLWCSLPGHRALGMRARLTVSGSR